jgi:hypothetical protein
MKTNRLQELAGIITEGALDPANEENIFNNLIDTDHSELVNKLLEAADTNPSLTLVDFLKTFDIGAGEEDDLNEVEEDESTTNPYEEAISYLEDISKKGELTPDQIKDIVGRLTSARKQFFTSQRTPDSYKSSAEKAKATIAKDKANTEKWRKIFNDRNLIPDAKDQAEKNILPIEVNDYFFTPDPKYYDLLNKPKPLPDDRGPNYTPFLIQRDIELTKNGGRGYGEYIIKDEYRDKPISGTLKLSKLGKDLGEFSVKDFYRKLGYKI